MKLLTHEDVEFLVSAIALRMKSVTSTRDKAISDLRIAYADDEDSEEYNTKFNSLHEAFGTEMRMLEVMKKVITSAPTDSNGWVPYLPQYYPEAGEYNIFSTKGLSFTGYRTRDNTVMNITTDNPYEINEIFIDFWRPLPKTIN